MMLRLNRFSSCLHRVIHRSDQNNQCLVVDCLASFHFLLYSLINVKRVCACV